MLTIRITPNLAILKNTIAHISAIPPSKTTIAHSISYTTLITKSGNQIAHISSPLSIENATSHNTSPHHVLPKYVGATFMCAIAHILSNRDDNPPKPGSLTFRPTLLLKPESLTNICSRNPKTQSLTNSKPGSLTNFAISNPNSGSLTMSHCFTSKSESLTNSIYLPHYQKRKRNRSQLPKYVGAIFMSVTVHFVSYFAFALFVSVLYCKKEQYHVQWYNKQIFTPWDSNALHGTLHNREPEQGTAKYVGAILMSAPVTRSRPSMAHVPQICRRVL